MNMKIKKAVCALLSAVLVSSSLGTFAQDAQNDEFDESNIVLRFGVLSDIHLSGSWNTAGNSKLDKAYKTLLELAEKDNNGKSKLDAVFIDGDITDALNSSGNISSSMQKLKQNYLELAAFRDNAVNNFNAANGAEHVAVIYAAGNHDTSGGTALDENKQADSTGFYSAKLMQKIFSGYTWTNSVPGKDSPTDAEIAEYNKTLLTEYNEKEGLYYDFFYGNDLNFGSLGLDYGNRHAEINGYHFITVEPQNYDVTYSEETLDWLDGLLCEITEENPDKAVFVATHPRIKGTIFASVDQVSEQLSPILSKYPQVFIWGGHNHSPLNRETAIWQGGKGTFTALDAGVVQYATSSHFSYEGNKNPDNGKNFGGYSGTEYRKFSQGNYVEVDADGNVRVHRIDFYNSDLDAGVIKEIGTPWTVTGISADGSHLDKYTLDARKNTNTAPYFDTSAKLSAAATEEGLLSISFPAAKDDLKIISYFASVDKADGTNVAKSELTSFYYDHADEKELENLTYDYTFTQEMPTNCELTVSVYAVDDFGAQSSSLTAKTTIVDESSLAFPAKEFNLSNLNKNGWSSNSQGSLTHGVTFEGRTASEIKKISTNTKNPLIMNHWSTPFNGIDTNPYLVVDYYYQHDENSTYAPAPKMRWRFYIKAQSGKQLTFEANLKTNKWATAVIPLKNYIESFAADGYYGKQYKFDPWGTTALTSIDDNDKLYISGIRLVHDDPTVFTENGKAYVSSDSYIKGVSAKVYPTIAEGFAALGTSGGTVYVQGDIIADEGTHIEASGSERAPVTVQGFGKTLSEQQANRIWFRATKVGREIPYNGDTTFDKITLKAPTDEAGIFSKG
ncbi:MAG: metallophosphoesterase, partial [Clostridia bacterium]|nr:metallophosphoesterase [Clostridia bacterium]